MFVGTRLSSNPNVIRTNTERVRFSRSLGTQGAGEGMPTTPQSSFAVARYFIEQSQRDGILDLTPMKVLKLVYIAHGWVLSSADAPLISESVQAWKFGPVIPSLYHYFKRYGASPVPHFEANALPS